MDSMITGCLLARAYIHELQEETPEGEFWEPKPSWLERFGTEVLGRLGIMRAKAPVEAAPVEQGEPCADTRLGVLVEG